MIGLQPKTQQAYDLLHNGILALARAERQGMRIDVEYIAKQKIELTDRIDKLEEEFKDSEFFRKWQKSTKNKININSGHQLGEYLYGKLGIEVTKTSKSGKGSTDEEALKDLEIPELDNLIKIGKLKKVRDTYLAAFEREQVKGFIHPFFNLHLVTTYRSCIAKGSLILVVRDFIKHPKGIPIEDVRAGDYVYCFDDNLKLAIQKVLWAGKTGNKEVIRIHYSSKKGGKGYLDTTPEHKIRLSNGEYVQAQNLVGDFRSKFDNYHLPKISVLSCHRTDDELMFTGCLKNGRGVLEQPSNHTITKIEWIHKNVDVYDIEVEKYHNFFANELCVHNSSDSPNFQNIPKRDKEAMALCRGAIFPRIGNKLFEFDFSGAEVKTGVCYHKDPMMLKYIQDKSTDMHGDLAQQLFMIDGFDKSIKEHYTLRQAAKNGFVFPQFYGSYWKNCAPALVCEWGQLSKFKKWGKGQGLPLPNGEFLSDHFISKGINSLGEIRGKYEVTGYMKHVKSIEEDFWGNRFPGFAKWKDKVWAKYQKEGHIDFYTGFRTSGVLKKTDVTNYPIQGSAFHCLLWSLTQLDKFIIDNKLQSRIVGQIHDSIIVDMNPDEIEIISKEVHEIIINKLAEHWKWLIVPMEYDVDEYELNGSWASPMKT